MNSKSAKRLCKARKKDGTRCKVIASLGSDFCFFHDPDRAIERKAARSQGGSCGLIRTLLADAPDVRIDSCADVVTLISETINQVRRGQIDPKVGNCVGYLLNIGLKALDQGDVEKRLEDLEALVAKQGQEFRKVGA